MLLAEQVYAFLITVIMGLIVGFCYDFYLVTKRNLRLKRIGTYVGDFIFWIIVTVLVFGLLIWSNWGEIRFYVFLGLGIGVAAYLKILSRSAVCILQICFSTVQKLWKMTKLIVAFLWKAILFPIKIILIILCFPFRVLNKLFFGVVTACKRIMKKLFRRPARAVKQHLRKLKSFFKTGKQK